MINRLPLRGKNVCPRAAVFDCPFRIKPDEEVRQKTEKLETNKQETEAFLYERQGKECLTGFMKS